MPEHFEISAEISERPILVVGFEDDLTDSEIESLLENIRRLDGVTDAEQYDSEMTYRDLAVENNLRYEIQDALRNFVKLRSMDGENVGEFIRQHLLFRDS